MSADKRVDVYRRLTVRGISALDRIVELEERLAENEHLRQIAWCAKEYLDCLAEFTDTAAGNLSNCCQEYLHNLDGAVDYWRASFGEPIPTTATATATDAPQVSVQTGNQPSDGGTPDVE